jgi:ferredoxin
MAIALLSWDAFAGSRQTGMAAMQRWGSHAEPVGDDTSTEPPAEMAFAVRNESGRRWPEWNPFCTLGPMRVIVDWELCESNALCMAAAPEVFEVRDDDRLYVLVEEPGEELRSKVELAVKSCPMTALSIAE